MHSCYKVGTCGTSETDLALDTKVEVSLQHFIFQPCLGFPNIYIATYVWSYSSKQRNVNINRGGSLNFHLWLLVAEARLFHWSSSYLYSSESTRPLSFGLLFNQQHRTTLKRLDSSLLLIELFLMPVFQTLVCVCLNDELIICKISKSAKFLSHHSISDFYTHHYCTYFKWRRISDWA